MAHCLRRNLDKPPEFTLVSSSVSDSHGLKRREPRKYLLSVLVLDAFAEKCCG